MQVSVFRSQSHAQNCVMMRRIVQPRTCSGVMRVSRPRDLVSCCAAPCCTAHMQDSAGACLDEGETMADPVTWCPNCKAYGHVHPVPPNDRWCPNDPTHQGSEPMSPDGAALIAAERQRQVEQEGWTPEHDAVHDGDDLTRAATAYLTRDPEWWPWGLRYWKPVPADRVRELVKAGALIAAEIDRLQRADAPASRLYTEAGHRRAIPGFSLDATEGAHE